MPPPRVRTHRRCEAPLSRSGQPATIAVQGTMTEHPAGPVASDRTPAEFAQLLELRGAIVAALRPFPEAARAVGAALHGLEAGEAQAIAAGKPVMIEGRAA